MQPSGISRAVRSLAKARGTTLAAVLSLVLGIGSTTTVFSVMDSAVTKPLPCPSPDRIVTVMEKHPERGLMVVRPANYLDWRERAQTIERSAALMAVSVEMAGADQHVDGELAGEGLFDTWGVRPQLGRGFVGADYQMPVAPDSLGKRGGAAVVSDGFWKRRFGSDPGVLGRTLVLDGAVHTIVGVMPPSFHVIDRSDIWIPWIVTAADWTDRQFHNFPIVARLRPGVSREQAQREMAAIYQSLAAAHPENADWSVELIPPRQLLVGRMHQVLGMLFCAVVLVLLIACANVSSLLLARGMQRRRETAVRLALGCSRARLIGQQLLEGTLLAMAGAIGGIAFAAAGIRIASRLPVVADVPFAFAPSLDGRVAAFTVVVSTVSVLAFAVIPAWLQSRTDLAESLKTASKSIGSSKRHRLRSLIVTTEVALGVVVVAATALMVRSLVRLEEVNPGVRTENVLTFGLEAGAGRFPNEASVANFFEQVLARVRGLSGVEEAAVGNYIPLTTLRRSWRFSIEGRPATSSRDEYFAVASEVSRGFFSTLGIGLLAGRAFDHTDQANSPQVVVMSQTAARRFWPNGSPIGDRIKVAGIDAWFTVVGVAADVHQEKLDTAPLPALYVLHDQSPNRSMTLVVWAPGGVDSLVDSVRAAIHLVDPNQPIDRIRSMDSLHRRVLAAPRLKSYILAFFAASSLLLAAFGIYAVTSQLSKERQGEIGVRMALGATWSAVVLLVIRKAAAPVGAGLVVGTLMALSATRLIRGLLFGVTPSDPTSFLLAAGAFLVVALLASALPAHEAARADPLQVLRRE